MAAPPGLSRSGPTFARRCAHHRTRDWRAPPGQAGCSSSLAHEAGSCRDDPLPTRRCESPVPSNGFGLRLPCHRGSTLEIPPANRRCDRRLGPGSSCTATLPLFSRARLSRYLRLCARICRRAFVVPGNVLSESFTSTMKVCASRRTSSKRRLRAGFREWLREPASSSRADRPAATPR